MESRESSIPPRPGIMFPLSFIPAERLNTDSARSPTMEENAMSMPVMISFTSPPSKRSCQMKYPKTPAADAPSKPPIKPTRLLFGLALTKPRVLLPKRTPKNQATLSVKNTMMRKMLMHGVVMLVPYICHTVILEMKVRRNPVYVIMNVEVAILFKESLKSCAVNTSSTRIRRRTRMYANVIISCP